MRIELAGQRDTDSVMELITLCIQHLRANGVYQWDDVYPDLRVIEEDSRSLSLYVLRMDGICVASVCLNDLQPDEYLPLPWRCMNGRALVIHRLCVNPKWQGRGIGGHLMAFAESFAFDHGFSSIRLDAYTGNPQALALYVRRNYQRVGRINFPRLELPFDCFEKILSKSEQAD